MSKNDRNKKRMVSDKQLEKYKQVCIKETMDLWQMITLWALHNSEGFGEKRLSRVLEEMNNVAELIVEKYLTKEDIRETLEKETGLKFILKEW